MDSYSKRHAKDTQRIRFEAEMKLELALRAAQTAAREIAELYKDDDRDLLCIIKYNNGVISRLDAQSLMALLVHNASIRQLYINHDERRKDRHETQQAVQASVAG